MNDWGSGFQAQISAPDVGNDAVNVWTLEFDFAHDITSIWDAQIVSHTGNEYVVTHDTWNRDIAAGGSLSFGFTATAAASITPPADYVFSEHDAAPSQDATAPATVDLATVDLAVVDDWGSGFVADLTIGNRSTSDVDGWTLEFDFAGDITNIWNATIIRHEGDHYEIGNAGWNGMLAAGQSVQFGFQGTPGNLEANLPANYLFNGQPLGEPAPPLPAVSISDTSITEGDAGITAASLDVSLSSAASQDVSIDYEVVAGTADSDDVVLSSGSVTIAAGQFSGQIEVGVLGDEDFEADETFRVLLRQVAGATVADGEGLATILNDDVSPPPPPPVSPTINIADATVTEPDLVADTAVAAGFFSTRGNQIIDAAGNTVKLSAAAWFGFESETNSPHGLWTRNYRDMMDDIVAAGFNTLRLPINNEMFDAGKLAGSIDAQANPELVGLSPLEVLDRIVEYAGQIDLRIVLDHHRSDNGIGALNDGLWYTAEYPENRFISDWVMLAERYGGNPTVIGADLHNEPHGAATWGSGNLATDWRLAAERAGNAILEVNPDWLIFVEGIESYDGNSYWWGGNLQGVRDDPVRLDVPNQLVYSPHAYPNSIYAQPWFSDPAFPDNLPQIWHDNWGYIYEENIAPVWIGEFGSRLEDPKDVAWMEEFVGYLGGDLDGDGIGDVPAGDQAVSWSFWSWNPNSGDTGGILLDDWRTFDQQKLDLLAPVQFGLLTPDEDQSGGGGSSTSPETAVLEFVVTLSEPTTVPVFVDFTTEEETATAGVDFRQLDGTLQFLPGETKKIVQVEVIGDEAVEADETLSLRLLNATGGEIDDGLAVGTIVDNDEVGPAEEPLVSIADATVEEGATGDPVVAEFRVTLDEPATAPVTVSYRTLDGSAVAGQDYQATNGQLIFAAGEIEQTIQVPILGDDTVELDEAFSVELFNLVDARPADLVALGRIVDNDVDETPSGSDVQIALAITNDWTTGFNGELVITNHGDEPITGWQLVFHGNFTIRDLWNGVLTDLGGGQFSVSNASWNATIAPGTSLRIGFTADGTSGSEAVLSNLVFNGIALVD